MFHQSDLTVIFTHGTYVIDEYNIDFFGSCHSSDWYRKAPSELKWLLCNVKDS